MISAAQKDTILLADIDAVHSDDPALQIWWLGQSGFFLKQAGATILIDPYLSDALTIKYAATDKPHVRMTEQCIAPGLLRTPLVLSSHQHTDHFDEATLNPLAEANPGMSVVIPAGVKAQARTRVPRPDLQWHLLNDTDSVLLHGWEVIALPAAHNEIERDEAGRCKFLGFVVRRNGYTVYHSGDSLLYAGLSDLLKPCRPDVALVPINGNKPERRVAGNMNGKEAAWLAKEISAGLAVPHHFEMFEFNTASTDEFIAECTELNQPYRVMRCGERITLAR